MRTVRAQQHMTDYVNNFKWPEDDNSYSTDEEAGWVNQEPFCRVKYEIPEDVFLWAQDLEGALIVEDAHRLGRYISAFVRGKMSTERFGHMWFFLEELSQCDYGWIFLDLPIGYYMGETGPSHGMSFDEIVSELQAIATRSKTKSDLDNLFYFKTGKKACK